jgi:PHD/YefM family antitoxin component YafN of YafNO toxin-antitoxin module
MRLESKRRWAQQPDDGKMATMKIREWAAEYVVKNGKRKAVILPIEEYEELLEDLHDLGVIASRRHDKMIPFEDVLRRLKKKNA